MKTIAASFSGNGGLGASAEVLAGSLAQSLDKVALAVSSVIIPEGKVDDGVLIKATSVVWMEIVRALRADWTLAYQLPPERWEELIAGAFKNEGYEVVLTPRSGDQGRDVIATRHGVLSIRILGQVKAYKPGHLVSYEAIRALAGVVDMDTKASKGVLTTTSDFPPEVNKDKLINGLMPTRLELINYQRLQQWLDKIYRSK